MNNMYDIDNKYDICNLRSTNFNEAPASYIISGIPFVDIKDIRYNLKKYFPHKFKGSGMVGNKKITNTTIFYYWIYERGIISYFPKFDGENIIPDKKTEDKLVEWKNEFDKKTELNVTNFIIWDKSYVSDDIKYLRMEKPYGLLGCQFDFIGSDKITMDDIPCLEYAYRLIEEYVRRFLLK